MKTHCVVLQPSLVDFLLISNPLFRNSPVLCDVFPQLNMQLWKTDTPALQVPEAILIQTLEKGTQGLAQRRKEEFRLWENSKYAVCKLYALCILYVQYIFFERLLYYKIIGVD